jgi:muconolactone D-isomerase
MLFHVEMDVRLPPGLDAAVADRLKATERERAQELQRAGKWRHLWRVAGRYANVSIFDVESPAELHDLLSELPLFPYMEIKVTALCRHPSSIHDDDGDPVPARPGARSAPGPDPA